MSKKESKFNRYTALIIIMFLIFTIIISKLIYLQIYKGDYYRDKASSKAVRNLTIAAPRGKILDRNGEVLALSVPGYTLTFTETVESSRRFFTTMKKVFDTLDMYNEKQDDDFQINIDPMSFGFQSSNPNTKRWMELRFKKDIWLDEKVVMRKFFKGKKKSELTKEEKQKVDEELLKISPEETFNYLLDIYGINSAEKKEVFEKLMSVISKTDLENAFKNYDISGENYDNNKVKLYKIITKENNKQYYTGLLQKYNISPNVYSLELKRRFMIVKDRMRKQSYYGFKPIVIASNISKETAFIFMQQYEEVPGVEITMEPIREYSYGELGASFLGYLSKINPWQKEEYEERGYDASSDYIGASGIESAYENVLKGSKGIQIVQINKHGRITQELARKEPYPGKNIELTIDKNLQHTAEKSLESVMKSLQERGRAPGSDVDTTNATRGAAVVLNVNTGEVLAMVSKPGYDPNLFAVPGRLTSELQKEYFNPDLKKFGEEYVKKLLKTSEAARIAYEGKTEEEIIDKLFPLDRNIENNTTIRQDYYDVYPKPLYNYATKTLMPPGSTFKPLVGIAGLEENVIAPNEKIYDGIVYKKNNYNGKDWNKYSYGYINVSKALEASINYFFFEVSDRLFDKGRYNHSYNNGYDAIAKYAWKFGLGAPKNGNAETGIEISERFGQVYNLESCRKLFSNMHLNNVLYFLKKGTDTQTKNYDSHYTGIDLYERNYDSESVKKLKKDILSRIKEEMMYKRDGGSYRKTKESDIIKEMKQSLNEITELSPEIYQYYNKRYSEENTSISLEKYIDKNIYYAALAINYSIANALYDIRAVSNVYNASIGQGINQFTPLQLTNYISTIMNGGKRYKVHLVNKILDQDGTLVKQVEPEIVDEVELKESTINAIKKGMYNVVYGDQGTAARALKDFPIPTGGKTGSATFRKDQEEFGRTAFGVYVGFAPFDNPEIAVCVAIVDGGHGGYAAPVARAIYEEYFKNRLKSEFPEYIPKYDYNIVTDQNVEQEKTESEQDEELQEEIEPDN